MDDFLIIYYKTPTKYTRLNTAKQWQKLSLHVSANHGPSSWEKFIYPGKPRSICIVSCD